METTKLTEEEKSVFTALSNYYKDADTEDVVLHLSAEVDEEESVEDEDGYNHILVYKDHCLQGADDDFTLYVSEEFFENHIPGGKYCDDGITILYEIKYSELMPTNFHRKLFIDEALADLA